MKILVSEEGKSNYKRDISETNKKKNFLEIKRSDFASGNIDEKRHS